MKDPIVEEVRRIRDELSAEFDYDLSRIFAHIKERERASGHEYCSHVPKTEVPQRGDSIGREEVPA